MERWHDFFVAQTGASAALTGLLFVGVSLNLSHILSLPGLPGRAFHGLALLLVVLIVSSLMLIPDQPRAAVGIELLVVGLVTAVLGFAADLRVLRLTEAAFRLLFMRNMALSLAASLPYAVGGAVVLAGQGDGGLYWVAAAILISLARAVTDAWVLLVEINR